MKLPVKKKTKKYFKAVLFLIFCSFFYFSSGCLPDENLPSIDPQTRQSIEDANNQEQRANDLVLVERVMDGDTFVLAGGERVRLIGVDAPDSKPVTSSRSYEKEANEFTKHMLEGKQVNLVFDVQERDQYGRLLAYVYLEDGGFFNELLVREGYATVYTVPPNVAKVEILLKAQRYALENALGLWSLAEVSAELDKLWLDEKGKGLIKGSINREGVKIYHLPKGQYYEQTTAELWFKTEREALRNGFRKSRR